jgi:hypothetical protein
MTSGGKLSFSLFCFPFTLSHWFTPSKAWRITVKLKKKKPTKLHKGTEKVASDCPEVCVNHSQHPL